VINSGKHDVVTLDWFRRITDRFDEASHDPIFLPWELLSSRDTTGHRFAGNYDEYCDSFAVDADRESLRRSFDRIAESVNRERFRSSAHRETEQRAFIAIVFAVRSNLISNFVCVCTMRLHLARRGTVDHRTSQTDGRGIVRRECLPLFSVQGRDRILRESIVPCQIQVPFHVRHAERRNRRFRHARLRRG